MAKIIAIIGPLSAFVDFLFDDFVVVESNPFAGPVSTVSKVFGADCDLIIKYAPFSLLNLRKMLGAHSRTVVRICSASSIRFCLSFVISLFPFLKCRHERKGVAAFTLSVSWPGSPHLQASASAEFNRALIGLFASAGQPKQIAVADHAPR